MDAGKMHLDSDALYAYAEGALDTGAQAAAETHLRDCPDCLRELNAARAYLRGMQDLESVKAPANFLAGVRARLPQPSPWKAFLLKLTRPMRVIPLQIAVLTVLGITAITAYLYQKGGLVAEMPLRIPAPGMKAESGSASAPAQAKARLREEERTDSKSSPQAPPVASLSAPRLTVPNSPDPGASAKRAAPQTLSRKQDAPGEADANLDAFGPASAGGLASDRSVSAMADKAPMAPAPAPAANTAPGRLAVEDAKPSAQKARGFAKREMEAAAEKSAEPAGGGQGSMAKDAKGWFDQPPLPRSFLLHLQAGKDTQGLLAGLEAMGVLVQPRSEREIGGYRLLVPPSMIGDLRPYLEKYGKADLQGEPMPAHPTRAVTFDLQIEPPGP